MGYRYFAPLLTLPASDVDDAPLVCFHFNQSWIEVLLNLVERADKEAAWVEGTDFDRAEQQALQLFYLVANAETCEEDSMAAPIGSVQAFAGSAAPSGWLLCHGQAVSRSTYSLLFFVIGEIYGAGDGTTTFNLPDLRGRTVIGVGDGGAAFTNRNLGDDVGEESHLLTVAQLPRHNHEITAYGGAASVSGTNIVKTTNSLVPSLHQTTDAGLSERHSNMQPSLALNFIIYAGD